MKNNYIKKNEKISKRVGRNKVFIKLSKLQLSLSDGVTGGGTILVTILGDWSFYGNGVIEEMLGCSLKNGTINTLCTLCSHNSFTVNQHSVIAWMSRNSCLETGAISEI